MIRFEHVSLTYDGQAGPVLRDVNLTVDEGEMALVVGGTGSGKSTLLGLINGLVPHFTGGTMSGRVVVAGRDTRTHPPRELADVVGVVRQDPRAGFVTDIVEDELAYTMETLAVPPQVMRRRVEEALDLLGLAGLRRRPLRTLSGGQRQRVAIGSMLTAHPRALVLDEPTSALDPQAAEEVLAAVQRLVNDLGMTVIVSEHRLERVVQYADRVLVLQGTSVVDHADPADAMVSSPVAPPIVELGRAMGWSPLPLSIRDARSAAKDLRQRLRTQSPDPPPRADPTRDAPPDGTPPEVLPPVGARPVAGGADGGPRTPGHGSRRWSPKLRRGSARGNPSGPPGQLRNASLRYGPVVALNQVSVTLDAGQITAVMGRNGAGKSTLLKLLVGQVPPTSGTVRVGGVDPTGLSGSALLARVALVPQEPETLLWAESVALECAAADADAGARPGTAVALLSDLLPGVPSERHPADLSEGSRLLLVLALMLTAHPCLLLLDEPTRGLDYAAKRRLSRILRERAAAGTAIVVATHDVELVAALCDRVLIVADGDLVTDDAARHAVIGSPSYAPQVAKIVAPLPYLSSDEVLRALAAAP